MDGDRVTFGSGLGVGAGRERHEQIQEARAVQIGEQLAVVNVQLVDAGELGVAVP